MKENNYQLIRVIDVNNTEEFWQRYLKGKKGPYYRKIDQKTITKMANLLFENITEDQLKEFEKLIKHEFSWHKCVCIRKTDPVYFEKFCEEHGFEDIGKKEVILTSDETIQYSKDFRYRPEAIQ